MEEIRELKDQQARIFEEIYEHMDEIKQTSVKVKRNTRLVIHVEHPSITSAVTKMLKEYISNSDESTIDLLDDILITCGDEIP